MFYTANPSNNVQTTILADSKEKRTKFGQTLNLLRIMFGHNPKNCNTHRILSGNVPTETEAKAETESRKKKKQTCIQGINLIQRKTKSLMNNSKANRIWSN